MCATGDVFAVGNAGTAIRWDGTLWAAEESGTTNNLRAVQTLQCSAANADSAWAVGDSATILHRTCNSLGACTWGNGAPNGVPTGTGNLLSVAFVGTSTGWAVGNNGKILKTSNGGMNWVEDCDTDGGANTDTWNAVFALSATDIWVVGNGGKIRHNTTGNTGCANWPAVTSPTSVHLRSDFFVGADDGWAAGASGTILRYTDVAWNIYLSPTKKQLNDVDIPTPVTAGEGWIVGNSGRILKGPSTQYPSRGTFLSSVLDTDGNATWATLYPTFGALPAGTSATVAARSGNVAVPDSTWSAFTAETSDTNGAAITMPAARFLQYRATLQTTDLAQTPEFDACTVTYRK
jgi:photosystem II stability/assembly factor-like uncharacterized protein